MTTLAFDTTSEDSADLAPSLNELDGWSHEINTPTHDCDSSSKGPKTPFTQACAQHTSTMTKETDADI